MLLAIDSSSLTASAALVRDGVLLAEGFLNNGLTHSVTLAPMIDGIIKAAGALPADIDTVVVTNGPGSFTGLRIGVATALGFASGLGIPCHGVSSLMAAAYGAADYDGIICAAMDARRNEYYSAAFRAEGGVLTRLTDDRAVDKDTLLSETPAPALWTGDAARLCARPGDRIALRPFVTGYGAALCFLNGFSRDADKIVYLRLPQAERERLARL